MIRRAVRVRRADAAVALAALIDLAPTGLEERDVGEQVEFALYGEPADLPETEALRTALGVLLLDVVSVPVAADWAKRWRDFHRPVLIAGRLHVRPPWSPPWPDDAARPDGVRELVVDPGQAFGTGGHGTTRLCLELLVDLAAERAAARNADVAASAAGSGAAGGPVLDLGCGSGVLAIAAAQLGWGPVHGVDHEPASVAATLQNAAANGVTVTAARFDLLRDGPARLAPGALVCANLLRPLLLRVAADGFVDPAGAPVAPDVLIASGLLVAEADEVAAAFAPRGLVEAERRDDGEWAALLLRRREEEAVPDGFGCPPSGSGV